MPSPFVLKFDENLEKFTEALERLGSRKEAERAYRSVINKTGTRVRKGVLATLPKQVGLKKKTITKALGKPKKAHGKYKSKAASLEYVLTTKGGYIGLKHFKAREYAWGGVGATPRGKLTKYPKAFIKGGRFPNRKTLNMPGSGAVFRPNLNATNRWRRDFHSLKSDVRIPDEMVTGPSKSVYDREVKSFQPAIEAEILKRLAKAKA